MKLRVVGLGMEYSSHDGAILSRDFPFLVWPEDKLDFNLSPAFEADTRGLFQQEPENSELSRSEVPWVTSGIRRFGDFRIKWDP
jgi:hypothetical protein